MYDSHYGLTGRPFQLTPDPEFWFETATHRKAMAYLGYGLSQGEGFIVITGEPGAGKTTLVGHVMGQIDPERLHVIKIVTTQVAADDLIRMVAQGLGVNATGLAKADLLAAIERGLHAIARTGKRTLLIVDEAQSLLVGSLEELRMLSNFQLGGHPLLQIFLLGQPEFRVLLQGSDKLEQLRQRVIAMHHLDPMGVEEVEAYLAHRLGVVGWSGQPRFGQDAIAEMHRWSGGIPRKLNQIANRVMLFGAIEGIEAFTGEDVAQVVSDIDGDMHSATRDGTMPDWADDSVPAASAEPAPVEPPPVEPAPVEPVLDHAGFAAQLAGIEARLTEQDRALRRVLTLLVDWVENDQRRHDYQSDAA